MQKKLMLEVHEEPDGLAVVKHGDCPDELADFVEGCLEWLRKSGLAYGMSVQKPDVVN